LEWAFASFFLACFSFFLACFALPLALLASMFFFCCFERFSASFLLADFAFFFAAIALLRPLDLPRFAAAFAAAFFAALTFLWDDSFALPAFSFAALALRLVAFATLLFAFAFAFFLIALCKCFSARLRDALMDLRKGLAGAAAAAALGPEHVLE
jgi:hypothetical protein